MKNFLSFIILREINFNEFTVHSSVTKLSKTRSLFLLKNQHFFRQINVFTKEVNKELISRKKYTAL